MMPTPRYRWHRVGAMAFAIMLVHLPASGWAADPIIPTVAATPKMMTVSATGDPPPEYYDGGIFDWQARTFFKVNRVIFDGLRSVGEWWNPPSDIAPEKGHPSGLPPQPPSGLSLGLSNVASNLVNEPVSALAGLIGGDFDVVGNAVGRFSINTTVGLLGWNDVATDWGFEPKPADIGLTLCKAGVGEGGYVMLPFVGPRTVRDGFADVVLVNAVLWTTAGVMLGTGATWEAILLAESVEIVADLLATRQIDPNAKVTRFDDFEGMRAHYLAQRRQRCAEARMEAAAR